MLLEIILALIAGIIAGTVAGLIPGIHINLVGASLAPALLFLGFEINPVYLVVFIVSMAVTQTFVDFIPSIFLGAPEDGSELSVLPGHELLKKGMVTKQLSWLVTVALLLFLFWLFSLFF